MALIAALAVYLAWTAATWLLEGWPRTLLRPQAVGLRLVYDGVANIAIGIAGAALVLSRVQGGRPPEGFHPPARTAGALLGGLALGLGVFFTSPPPSWTPAVVINGFARTFATSTAEIVVCWALCGAAVAARVRGARGRGRALGALVASGLFGISHLAHSPPFNSPRMVVFLTVVGLVTSAFYVVTADVWGTIAFHNGLAMIGVLGALAASSRLDTYATLQPVILATALASAAVLLAAHRALVARAGPAPRRRG
jgi:hypothetical protein